MKQKPKPKVKLPKPLHYQQEIIDWLDDPDVKYVSFLKSRQSGGSWLNKWLVAKWGLTKNKKKIGYITPTLKLGKLFHSQIVESLKPFITESNASDLTITFSTKTTVQFFSAEQKDAIRGNQFHYAIIDEAAFMSDDVFNYSIRQTWLTIGEKVILCSTPNGSQGFFYEFVNLGLNSEHLFKTKVISIYDNPYVDPLEIEQIKRTIPERVFRQEYLGEFLSGSGSVFSNYLTCVGENPKTTGKYYAGIDWAKQDDYTVLTIINDLNEVVEIYRINKIDYTEQVKLITAKLNKWKPIQTISEENNIGTVVNELLKKEYKGNLQCITLTAQLKKEIIDNLIVAFETNGITIPKNDILLRELQAFTVTYNHATGGLKYSAPSGLHDDCVISLAYAFYMRKNVTVNRFSFGKKK